MNALAPTIEHSAPRGKRNLVAHQFRYELRSFLRNRQGVFFTLALPVMFLVIFASVFGHGTVRVPGGMLHVAIYYVPGIIAMGIISASFGNLAASVVGTREAGIYKRRRATPVSAVVLIAARALVALVVAAVITAVLWPSAASTAPRCRLRPAGPCARRRVGSLAFCCLGYALASVLLSRDAVQPAVMFITLPLYFISGVFVPAPAAALAVNVAALFPVRHLAWLCLPSTTRTLPAPFRWGDLAVLAVWGVAGLIVAVRRFSWLPRGG